MNSFPRQRVQFLLTGALLFLGFLSQGRHAFAQG